MARDEQLNRQRVTNQQRDNAVAALREAVADGRLSFDEFDQRMHAALGAVTRGAIVEVLDDLVEPDRLDRVITDESVLGEGPGFNWENPLLLGVDKSDRMRLGEWSVPPFLEVHVPMSAVRLDFTRARHLSNVIDLVVVGGSMMGSLLIIVPEDWGVSTENLRASGQAQINSNVRTRPERGRARILLSGRSSGSVTVRHPSWWDRRVQEKFLRANPPRTALPGPAGA